MDIPDVKKLLIICITVMVVAVVSVQRGISRDKTTAESIKHLAPKLNETCSSHPNLVIALDGATIICDNTKSQIKIKVE